MTYQTLARKYRPQKFSDLVGQDTAALALANAIKLGRPAPAIIFTGVRGVGKTTTARLYAKALNCDNGPTPEPCGICESCLAISQGTHQDVLEIDGASNNGVDEVRILQETLEYIPQRSPYKVYIIDEVHMLTQSAFNALLKTLEEPPARVVFVFATTEINRVPKTILSRCQTFHLQKISQDVVFKRLAAILAAEAIPFSDDAVMIIAREGKGSMRDALTLLDQAIAQGSGRITRDVIDAICPSQSSLQLMDLLAAIVQKHAADIIRLVDACDQAGLTMAQLTEELARLARTAFIIRDVGVDAVAAQFLHFDRVEMEKLKALAAQAPLLDLNRIFRFLVQCRHDLDGSELDRFVVENYALEWCLDPGLPDLGPWLSGQAGAPQRDRGTGTRAIMSSPAAPAAPIPPKAPQGMATQSTVAETSEATEAEAPTRKVGSGSLRQMFQKNILEQEGPGAKPTSPPVKAPVAATAPVVEASPSLTSTPMPSAVVENPSPAPAPSRVPPSSSARISFDKEGLPPAPVPEKNVTTDAEGPSVAATLATATLEGVAPVSALPAPEPSPTGKPKGPPASVGATAKVFPATWRALVDAWKAQKPLQARILEEAYLVEYGLEKIVLATKNASLAAQKLLQPDVQRKISEQFADLFGFTGAFHVMTYSPELEIKVSPMQERPDVSGAAAHHQTLLDIRRDEKAQKREALLEDVRTHPITLEALACFGGTIENIELCD